MIIAIDGYEANARDRVGIGRYAYEILGNMYELTRKSHEKNLASNDVMFRIYLPETPREDMPIETTWWRYRIMPVKRLWTIVGLPLALAIDQPQPDVIFSPTHYSPRFVRIPKVISIMDVSYLHFPHLFKTQDLAKLTSWTKDSVDRSTKILTISQYSKNDIIQAYGIPAERVVVTYPGLSGLALTNMAKNSITSSHLPKKYILTVGTLQPRKNFGKLIEAFRILKKSSKTGEMPDLVIVGKKGWLYEEILSAPKKFGVEENVHFLEFVSDDELPGIYSKAECFVLPSLYEGFGLPVLEAMSYGVPVIVSNVSSLPEIAGEAAIYVDPNSVDSIKEGLTQAIKQKGTKEESTRIKDGLSRVKLFSWEKAAKQTLDELRRVANDAKGANA